jgi:hypothetical protein
MPQFLASRAPCISQCQKAAENLEASGDKSAGRTFTQIRELGKNLRLEHCDGPCKRRSDTNLDA